MKALARHLIVLVATLAALTATPSRAADLSHYEPIGFSPEGSLFAFEEWGVEDGSGAPYVNLYVIETATDRFVSGTPIRLGGGEPGDLSALEERRQLFALRAQAHSRLQTVLGPVAWRRGRLLAFSPVTDLTRYGRSLIVNPLPIARPVGPPLSLELETLTDLPGGENCPDFAGPVSGFRLTLDEGSGPRTIHEDERVPASRGCPVDYRLAGVEAFLADGGTTVAVLIQRLSPGFEGLDGRWMAVTLPVSRSR